MPRKKTHWTLEILDKHRCEWVNKLVNILSSNVFSSTKWQIQAKKKKNPTQKTQQQKLEQLKQSAT